MLGALIGQGHYFTAITSAIVMTMLLAWKEGLSRFAGGLQPEEIRSAVLLSLLTFVIYPLLPNRFIDPLDLLNPKQSWLIVVVIAGLGFANYVMLRLYGTRGAYYAAFLGGLVNSTATVAELSGLFRELGRFYLTCCRRDYGHQCRDVPAQSRDPCDLRACRCRHGVTSADSDGARRALDSVATCTAGRLSDVATTCSLVARLAAACAEICRDVRRPRRCGTLAQMYTGTLGFLALSIVGGLASSASTTATAAALAAAGK